MKYALITGATSGIGRAYAEKLGCAGYNLIVTGRRVDVIEAAAGEIRDRYGVEVEVVIADFTRREDVQALLETAEGKEIEFLVNNVGFGHRKRFLEDEYENQKRMIDVHIDAMCRISHSISRGMRDRGYGRIVNVSSLAAYTPADFNHLYSATKIFINTFSESLYVDLMDHGINVQALCPGFTRTDFHSKLDISEDTFKNRGLIRWMQASKVAEISMKQVEKRGGICIPGVCNRILYRIGRSIPKRIYYRIAKRMSM